MPYRIELGDDGSDLFDKLVDLGALDAGLLPGGRLAAVMPDNVRPEDLRELLGVTDMTVSAAVARDAGSVWIIAPRPFQLGRIRILPADAEAAPGALRLLDSAAFGTGLHPTTALCAEALDDLLQAGMPDAVLDVGTGSGVLALVALMMGVPRALGIDTDVAALRVAAGNARLNGLEGRLTLAPGGAEAISGTWPVVLANILAAPLIEMAPALARRVGHHGHLVLSGIPSSVEQEVAGAYKRRGMLFVRASRRDGWVALVMRASW